MTKPKTQGNPKLFTDDILVKYDAATGDWVATLAESPPEFQLRHVAGSPEEAVKGFRNLLIENWHTLKVREMGAGEQGKDS